MNRPVFRFAPSPNGHLHLGHALSALLNAEAAQRENGRLLLRIEDIDQQRCPPHLIQQTFKDLAWLGLIWEQPVRIQSQHMDAYQALQNRLTAMGLLYPCTCSREDIAAEARASPRDPDGQPLYPGTCKQRPPGPDRPHALRLDMAAAVKSAPRLCWQERGEGLVAAHPEAWGDLVLVRKDIGVSYHIAVVNDDALQGITRVIRGRDLYHATSIHRLLQTLLDLPAPVYQHHRLIETDGRKLAKSAGDRSLASLRAEGVTPSEIRRSLGLQAAFD